MHQVDLHHWLLPSGLAQQPLGRRHGKCQSVTLGWRGGWRGAADAKLDSWLAAGAPKTEARTL